MRARLAAAVFLAFSGLSLPVRAEQQPDLMSDVGALMGVRLYANGLMDYCFDKVDPSPAFKETSENWKVRNLEDMAVVDKVFVTLPVQAADLANLLQVVSNTITLDMAGAPSDLELCKMASADFDKGAYDVKVKAPEQLARVKAAAAKLP
jgi:hypothetical protein